MLILGSLSQGNLNDSVTLNVVGAELHDFLIDSGAVRFRGVQLIYKKVSHT